MTDRPILFSAPMVRALLDGTKTQTRRVVKFCASTGQHRRVKVVSGEHRGCAVDMGEDGLTWRPYGGAPDQAYPRIADCCPHGVPGDRLWVRETWRGWNATHLNDDLHQVQVDYQADGERLGFAVNGAQRAQARVVGGIDVGETRDPWRPSIHMPRWASRITLQVTDVHVERLCSISDDDARAEGVESGNARDFYALWRDTYGQESWGANPWVWVVGFKMVATDKATT